MLRTLTEKEALESQNSLEIEMNNWWSKLTHQERALIYQYHKGIFEQIKCQHKFVPINFYSSECQRCSECEYTIYPDVIVAEEKKCHCGGGNCNCADDSSVSCGCGDNCACKNTETREK